MLAEIAKAKLTRLSFAKTFVFANESAAADFRHAEQEEQEEERGQGQERELEREREEPKEQG